MAKWIDYADESRLVSDSGEIIATVTIHRSLGSPATYHTGLWGKFYNTLDAAKAAASADRREG